ncbi:3-deoxy-D-manno-octulosonic acid transferase [Salaquimonas pukyongi]|uniref:3-deoxy-D-manno-octulosonic acid transferase n=1 Tax=Salaquimonas pukyongi TaxID=2712698 RepID=UPI00096B82E8|nr:3-deoxy-D-manno-octulosonic acid transferase [Salaquimonas pukyongi]
MNDLITRLTLGGYRRFGRLIYPFMGPFLALRARRGKEDRARRYERYGYPSTERPAGPLVWFHAASVGESMAVLALIERVHAHGVHAVMTTGTVTSAKVVAKRLPRGAFHQYVPLDLEQAVNRFLDHWKPDLAVFTESEIWPTCIERLRHRRIPHVLVNARMSDKSYARWKNAPQVASALFESFSHVIAQSSLDAERYRKLGARPVVISGNLKVDTKELPYDEAELRRVAGHLTGRPAFIAASTHRGEEQILLDVFKRLKPAFPQLLLILVPRHPERGDEIEALAQGLSLDVARRSRKEAIRAITDVYLGDTIGEMGLYLRMAPIVYMGRSLAGYGGQNPLEPAAIGNAILSGKHVTNFRDSYRSLLSRKAVRLVEDGDMLAANLEFLLSNPDECERMIQAAQDTVRDMRGALDRTIDVLDSYVFPLTVKRKLEDIGNGD